MLANFIAEMIIKEKRMRLYHQLVKNAGNLIKTCTYLT